jgi:hypothetical protein
MATKRQIKYFNDLIAQGRKSRTSSIEELSTKDA